MFQIEIILLLCQIKYIKCHKKSSKEWSAFLFIHWKTTYSYLQFWQLILFKQLMTKFNPILAIKTTKTWQGNSRKRDLNPLRPSHLTMTLLFWQLLKVWFCPGLAPSHLYSANVSFLRLSLRVFWVSSTNNPPCRRIFWTSRAGTGSRVTTWSA